MAHKIGNVDRQEGTFQAWHGLTDVKKVIQLATCWLAKWDVEKRPMREPDGSESEYCRIVCTDDPSLKIGKPVHCETYGMISNADFLQICEDSMGEIQGATVESVGSVCDRGRIFVSVKVPDLKELTAAGRKFEPYLNFISSHDLCLGTIYTTPKCLKLTVKSMVVGFLGMLTIRHVLLELI